MLHHTLTFSSSQDTCTNEYDKTNRWLRATWKGFINNQDATRGATQTLEVLHITHAPYLLNDNSQLVGPWFDSIEWLQQEWVPQAVALGLRYVAHVMPADTNADITAIAMRHPEQIPFELQIFHQVEEAQEWLRSCQDQQQRVTE